MTNYKTVPNQKVITVNKQPTDGTKKENYYAAINLDALDAAARDLDAGAFKLWVYFAKNQDGFEFALSSKAVETTFGMKIRQYNSAVQELIEKNYLVNTKGNNYIFNEKPVNTKCNNVVDTKCNNAVNTKCNNPLLQNVIRNITDTTLDNTINNTDEIENPSQARAFSISLSEGPGGEGEENTPDGSINNPFIVSQEWLKQRHNYITKLANGLFRYGSKFYRMKEE